MPMAMPARRRVAARGYLAVRGNGVRANRRKRKIWHCHCHPCAQRGAAGAERRVRGSDHCAEAALFGRLQAESIKRDLHPPWPCLSLSRVLQSKRGSRSFGGKSASAVAVDAPCTRSRACMRLASPIFVWLRLEELVCTFCGGRSIDRFMV
jgi:hypothetical protein